MKIELHDRLTQPQSFSATRLVVRDDYGNVVATFLQITPYQLDVRVIGQPGFVEALQQLGITQSTKVQVLDEPEVLEPVVLE